SRARAKRDPKWADLVSAIAHDKRMAHGLTAFMNWCSGRGIAPDDVTDKVLQDFYEWLDTRTLHPRPRDVARLVPKIWNEAKDIVEGWPQQKLARISFRTPSQNLAWDHLDASFMTEADAYLAMRLEPDVFEEDLNYPKRPLAASTVDRQREHIRLAASVLVRNGAQVVDGLRSLAQLVEREAFKAVLRHYRGKAGGKPNAFAVAIAKTLIDVARYQVKVGGDEVKALKALAAKLPAVLLDLTDKNKDLLGRLEADSTRARLVFLPEELQRKAAAGLKRGKLDFVAAQVAVAVDILLVAPLRPQNLIGLNWNRHFREGVGGGLTLFIPKVETKSGKRDLAFDLPAEVAGRINWYRREVLPRLGASPDGDLFVTRDGTPKHQETLTTQIIRTIRDHVGLHMTPHQFRHFAAKVYLEEHPQDFQTVTDLLGHGWTKTTRIYAGVSSRRASRAYGKMLDEQRKALQQKRPIRRQGRS
ncbi:MAG TPA: site-specific integrase, partial [Propylenella sp.]|nr:site-specific integrase [Propylenella sp.]